jgi:thiamine-monophosphate kinase
MLEQPTVPRTDALNQLLRPYPRIAEGQLLSASGAATSCIDLSDGLGVSLSQLAAMTRLSYQVEFDALPLYRGLAALPPAVAKDIALYYGGDYELLATVRPDGLQALLERASSTAPRGPRLTVIGKVAASGGNVLLTKTGKEPLLSKGWEHFRSSAIR